MSASQKTKPTSFEVVEDVIHYTTKAGIPLTIDLDFPADVIKKATSDPQADDESQFAAVREWLGADFESAFEKMGALERARFIKTFFLEFAKAAELGLGESLSSSGS